MLADTTTSLLSLRRTSTWKGPTALGLLISTVIIPRDPLSTPFCLQLSKITFLKKEAEADLVVTLLTLRVSVLAQVPPPTWSVTSISYLVEAFSPVVMDTIVSPGVLLVGADVAAGVVFPTSYSLMIKGPAPFLILKVIFPSEVHSPVARSASACTKGSTTTKLA